MSLLKKIALIGPTASGKSSLALELASLLNAYIFSIDSLSVYRKIDIASAKPTLAERLNIRHFGIDIVDPDQDFDVADFMASYREAESVCSHENRPLILVGGSSFYLKSLIDGLSAGVSLDDEKHQQVDFWMEDTVSAHERLKRIDEEYAEKIDASDVYRIRKGLEIYAATGLSPRQYLADNPRSDGIGSLPVYEIDWPREVLRERIRDRTRQMLEMGLIDEVSGLEYKYGRAPQCMGAIGVKEVLAYLDGKVLKQDLQNLIATHTAQLAKRQQTFNRTQFEGVFRGSMEEVKAKVLKEF